MTKFKDRYILGEGYPFDGGGLIGLTTEALYGDEIELTCPTETIQNECPKYRLVLERVEEKEDELDKR